jgi:hypothetical protein
MLNRLFLNAELDRCNIDDRIWGDIRGMEVVKCQLTLPAFFDLISAHKSNISSHLETSNKSAFKHN